MPECDKNVTKGNLELKRCPTFIYLANYSNFMLHAIKSSESVTNSESFMCYVNQISGIEPELRNINQRLVAKDLTFITEC